MIPIEKNIIVVDEQGNHYESTYPKRAKGLVKNGRARFIDKNKICLVFLPNQNLEDKNMSDITNNNLDNTINETSISTEVPTTLTIEQIFEQIQKIINQTEHLNQALETLNSIPSGDSGDAYSPGDLAGEAKAKSIGDVVRERETTNQQTLRLLEKMYIDLRPVSKSSDVSDHKLKLIQMLLIHGDLEDTNSLFRSLTSDMI